MTTHQAVTSENYDHSEITLDQQSTLQNNPEDFVQENFSLANKLSLSKRQFRFKKRQVQKTMEDELEEKAEKELKAVGLYEDGMSKQQKFELLNVVIESQQLAKSNELSQDENDKWEDELLMQSPDDNSRAMLDKEVLEDDSAQSPVFEFCNPKTDHSEDELPALLYDNDTVPGSQDLFTSKPAGSSGNLLSFSPKGKFENNKSEEEEEIICSSRPMKKSRFGNRKRKLYEIGSPDGNASDREIESSPSKRSPSTREELDYRTIDAWEPNSEDCSKLRINCKDYKQLKMHSVPYFTPKGMDPCSQANMIMQDFEAYFKQLHEAQSQQLCHLPWGDPVSTGRHYRGTLDVINTRTAHQYRTYMENNDTDMDCQETISDANEMYIKSEQKEDPFLLKAIPLSNFGVIPRKCNEDSLFNGDALPSLCAMEDSNDFVESKPLKNQEIPFSEHDSDVSSEGSNASGWLRISKKNAANTNRQEVSNTDKSPQMNNREEINIDDKIECKIETNEIPCTPPKKFKPFLVINNNNSEVEEFNSFQRKPVNINKTAENMALDINSAGENFPSDIESDVPLQLNLDEIPETPADDDKPGSISGTNCITSEMEAASNPGRVACPLCGIKFPKSEIESHASDCNGPEDNDNNLPFSKKTPKAKFRCHICQQFFAKTEYDSHVRDCIASREDRESPSPEELPVVLPFTSKSATGSRLLDGLNESEGSSNNNVVELNSLSPIKTFQPITSQSNSLVDYHNQFKQAKSNKGSRTKAEPKNAASLPVRKCKAKKKS